MEAGVCWWGEAPGRGIGRAGCGKMRRTVGYGCDMGLTCTATRLMYDVAYSRWESCTMIRICKRRAPAQTFRRFTNEDCDWGDSGEMIERDDEGYILNDYVPDGSLSATHWEEMVARL